MKETTQAKIRNKLGPYKNLIALILDAPDNPKVKEYIKAEAEIIRDGFDDLFELVEQTSNEMEWPDEYIVCAAVWYKDIPIKKDIPHRFPVNIKSGAVFCGHRHPHATYTMVSTVGLRSVQFSDTGDAVGEEVQGFLTNKNRFVDRKEGMKIAIAAKQFNGMLDKSNYTSLYSEHIY